MPKNNQMSETAYLSKKQIRQASSGSSNKKKGSIYYFNNGEPFGSAVRSVVSQLLFVLVVFLIVVVAFWGKVTIQDKLSDDSVFTLTMSSKYSKTVSTEEISKFKASEDYGAAAVNAISAIVTPENTLTTPRNDYVTSVKSSLESAYGEDRVDVSSHVGNYEMLTEIYDAIKDGDAVFCLMALPEDKDDTKANNLVYCPIIKVNYSKNKIVVLTPYGDKRSLTADEFIAATRFTNKAKYSLSERFQMTFGLIAKNTVFIVTKE